MRELVKAVVIQVKESKVPEIRNELRSVILSDNWSETMKDLFFDLYKKLGE